MPTVPEAVKNRKAIAGRLKKLADESGGRLTPEAVVNDAKSPRSPLHRCFDWDDSEAARKWRLEQARSLIRTVKVEYEVTEGVVKKVKVQVHEYVRDPQAEPEEQGYVAVAKVLTDDDLKRDVLAQELGRAVALLNRARHLAEALGLAGEADELLDRLQGLRSRVTA